MQPFLRQAIGTKCVLSFRRRPLLVVSLGRVSDAPNQYILRRPSKPNDGSVTCAPFLVFNFPQQCPGATPIDESAGSVKTKGEKLRPLAKNRTEAYHKIVAVLCLLIHCHQVSFRTHSFHPNSRRPKHKESKRHQLVGIMATSRHLRTAAASLSHRAAFTRGLASAPAEKLRCVFKEYREEK